MDHAQIKRRVWTLLNDVTQGADPRQAWHDDAVYWGSYPTGLLTRADAIAAEWDALRTALPNLERRPLLFIGGENRDDPRLSGPRAPHLTASLGHYQGTFRAPLHGIAPTGGVVHLRYAEAHYLHGDRIAQSWVFLDLLDLARQAGLWPLPTSFGAGGMWPGPATGDGIRLDDAAPSGALDTVFAMHAALQSFDGKSLGSMPHAQYWHRDFMYYAGSGIGMARGLDGFRAHHQIPFLRAFPNRASEGHFIRISDGPYAVTGGTVTGTHSATYLGMPATGGQARMPVMDFYRVDEDGLIRENWLPIDLLGMAAGLGNDLLARIRHLAGSPDLRL